MALVEITGNTSLLFIEHTLLIHRLPYTLLGAFEHRVLPQRTTLV